MRSRRSFLSVLPWAALGLLLVPGLVHAQPKQKQPGARDIIVEAVNPMPAFQIRVTVDKPDRIYHEGEEVKAVVRSEKDGYLYLILCAASGKSYFIFPNEYQTDNRIKAGEDTWVPDNKSTFRLKVKAPFGTEVIKAIVSTTPLKEVDVEQLNKHDATPIDEDKAVKILKKDLEIEPIQGVQQRDNGQVIPSGGQEEQRQGKVKPKHKEWAEHQVEFTTVAAGGKPKPKPPVNGGGQTPPGQSQKQRRIGVFVGISKFKDQKIRQLKVSDIDAQKMAEVMKARCGLDDAVVLTNSDATLKNIEEVIRVKLPQATQPGDTVFLYWSGHGGRISNTDGTEPDGFDEYLVPYDGELGSTDKIRSTMLVDKTFGRWVQELDGRRVVVILDACHSGGQAAGAPKSIQAGAKGLRNDAGIPGAKGDVVFERKTHKGLSAKGTDFFFGRGFRSFAKDIGQKNAAVLASCKASEISFERREGDLSVMTYALVRALEGDGKLSLQDAEARVEKDVKDYIEKNYEGATQTPVLVDQTDPQPTFLRP